MLQPLPLRMRAQSAPTLPARPAAAADSPRARAPAAAAARRCCCCCCCPPTPPSHQIGIEGKKKWDEYRTSVSTKIRSVSNLCRNPNPLSPRSPFSPDWSAVSHPSQRAILIRHVSVTKCPLLSDLSPHSLLISSSPP